MAGTNIKMLGDDVMNKLAEYRLKAGNPSLTDLSEQTNVSVSTIRSAMSGYSVKWQTYHKLLVALGCEEAAILEFRDIWIKTKSTILPSVDGPVWAQELNRKMDLILERLGYDKETKTFGVLLDGRH